MKAKEVKVGGHYMAKVSGNLVTAFILLWFAVS